MEGFYTMTELAPAIEGVVPPHVPPELVKDLTIGRGFVTERLPHEIVDEIHRDFPPVFYAPNLMNGGGWVFRRSEDQLAIWQDAEHFSSQQIQPFAELAGGNWTMIPVEQDPPEHEFYRRLLMPFFSPKAAADLDDKIMEYARSQIMKFQHKGKCEFMKDFSLIFPSLIFLELMGMPVERFEEFVEWENIMLRDDDMDRVASAVGTVVNYFEQEIDARRESPGDDLLGFAMTAEVDGRKMTKNELVGLSFNLFLAGLDTVSAHLGHIFRHLAENPDQQEELRNNPELIDQSITEFMRAFGAVTITRTCVKDAVVAGVEIKNGDKVAVSTALASRDPEVYESPSEIIWDRPPSRSLSFGTGIHVCLGVHIARREIRAALKLFLELLPPFRIENGATIESDLGTVMMPFALPLEWDV